MATAVSETTPPKATYADLDAVPSHLVAELLDGELHTAPRPAARHSRAAFKMSGDLGPYDREPQGDEPGGWWLFFEPEIRLAGHAMVPDLAGWRRHRLDAPAEIVAFEIAPDWVCEILSPSTARVDRVKKMRLYARQRVAHVWLVDPVVQVLEVYELRAGQWVQLGTHAADEKVRAEPFAAVEIDLAGWWL